MTRYLLGPVAALLLLGCGATQSAECKKYLACKEEVEPGSTATLVSSYGASGTCWSGTAASAEACTSACKSQLLNLSMLNPSKAACQ